MKSSGLIGLILLSALALPLGGLAQASGARSGPGGHHRRLFVP